MSKKTTPTILLLENAANVLLKEDLYAARVKEMKRVLLKIENVTKEYKDHLAYLKKCHADHLEFFEKQKALISTAKSLRDLHPRVLAGKRVIAGASRADKARKDSFFGEAPRKDERGFCVDCCACKPCQCD